MQAALSGADDNWLSSSHRSTPNVRGGPSYSSGLIEDQLTFEKPLPDASPGWDDGFTHKQATFAFHIKFILLTAEKVHRALLPYCNV